MVRRATFLWVIFLAIVVAGCDNRTTCEKDPTLAECNPKVITPDWLTQGKLFLGTFEGKRAEGNFLIGLESYDQGLRKDKFYCEAHYGLVLANTQMFLGELNFIFKLVMEQVIAASPSGPELAPGPYMASAFRAADNKYDFNNNLEGKWASSLEPRLEAIAKYAEAVTQIADVADCSFSIGVETPAEIEKYEFVLNFGDNLMPIIQLIFKGRLDGAEARLFSMLARSLLGAGDFWLAHSLEMSIDVARIGYMLGLDPVCLQEDALACFEEGNFLQNEVNYLDAAFIFQDNPNLLGKSETRWDRRFNRVDNHIGTGFLSFSTFFDALSSRALYWKEQPTVDRQLDEYFIRYQDRNGSGSVDEGDSMGINITGLKCNPDLLIKSGNFTATQEEELRATCQDVESGFKLLSDTILRNSLSTSAEVVGEIEALSLRIYNNMHAVDNPGHAYERIPINSLDAVLVNFIVPIIEAYTPNWLEMDLAEYFKTAQPLRAYLPLWHFPFDTYTWSRFVLDSDLYDNGVSEYTLAEIMFEPSVDDQWGYTLFQERPTLSEPIRYGYDAFGGPAYITGMEEPADCLNAINLTGNSTLKFPVMSVAWPDATFGGLFWSNLGPWHNIYPEFLTFGSIDCRAEVSGFEPATNYSLTKGMWQYVAYLWDNFALKSLLGGTTLE